MKRISILLLLLPLVMVAGTIFAYPNPQCSAIETEGTIDCAANDLSPPVADMLSNAATAEVFADWTYSKLASTARPPEHTSVMASHNLTGRELRNNNVQMSGANGQETNANPAAVAFAEAVSRMNSYDGMVGPAPTITTLPYTQEVVPPTEIVVSYEATFCILIGDDGSAGGMPASITTYFLDVDYPNPFNSTTRATLSADDQKYANVGYTSECLVNSFNSTWENNAYGQSGGPPTLNVTVTDRTI